ncbi:MAG: hypothetical protein PHR00_01330 [Patescibacteria group bacterium]|nr:hypothetical protein [Patescibacteria group bacterium]
MRAKDKLILAFLTIAGCSLLSAKVLAWSEPTLQAPGDNRLAPINVGTGFQEKSGTLTLSNSSDKLIFRNTANSAELSFRANPIASYTLTFPPTQGGNNQVLVNNGAGVLSWGDRGAGGGTITDDDWSYDPDQTDPTSIFSTVLTRIGSGGTRSVSGAGNLYVQNNAEIDGTLAVGNNSFAVDSSGTLTAGNVPWVRLTNFPSACASNQYVAGVGASLSCQPLTNALPTANSGDTLRYNGTNWVANNYLYNDGTRVAIGSVGVLGNSDVFRVDSGSATLPQLVIKSQGYVVIGAANANEINPGVTYKFQINTNTAPYTDKIYDLGKDTVRWNNFYSNHIYLYNDSVSRNDNDGGILFIDNDSKLIFDKVNFFWDRTNKRLGIGTGTPKERLEVSGNILLSGTNSRNGYSGTLFLGNTKMHTSYGYIANPAGFFGSSTSTEAILDGAITTPISSNIFIGQDSGPVFNASFSENDQKYISYNTAMGYKALGSIIYSAGIPAQHLAAFGANALRSNTNGNNNVAVGSGAMAFNTTGSRNVALGTDALLFGEMSNNSVIIGYQASRDFPGNHDVYIGSEAGRNDNSPYDLSRGDFNIGIGDKAGFNANGGKNITIGDRAGYFATGVYNNSNNIIIGNRLIDSGSQPLMGGGANNLYLGSGVAKSNDGSQNVFLGMGAGREVNGISNILLINSDLRISGTNFTNSLIAGRFYNSVSGLSAYARINGRLIITPNNSVSSAITDTLANSAADGWLFAEGYGVKNGATYAKGITNGICVLDSATTFTKLFYVNGLLICRASGLSSSAVCSGYALATCCTAQGGCNP